MSWINEYAELIQTLAAVVASVGVVAGVYFGVRQLKAAANEARLGAEQLEANKRSTQGGFLLAFDQMLDRYDPVHKKLRPGGEWAAAEIQLGPDEWAEIERYMGLFERVKILIDDGFLDLETFDYLYGYRVRNIEANPTIKREKLVRRAWGWKHFIELSEALKKQRESRAG
jgi:hypothetical protein